MSTATMHRRSVATSWLPFFVVAAAVCAAWSVVIHRGSLASRPALLAGGIAIDLFGTVTLAYWWLVVRAGRASARSIVTVVVLACIAARVLLPTDVAERFGVVRFALALGELGLVAWGIARVRRARAAARLAGESDDDLAERIEAACRTIAPNPVVARIAATEFATLAYAFARRPRRSDASGAFAVAPAILPAMLWTLVGIAAIEIAPMHLLISRWSVRAAWLVTALGAYSVVWLIGHFRAVTMRRCAVTAEAITLRVGLRCDAVIAPADIASVVALDWKTAGKLPKSVYQPGRPQPANVLLTFREPVRIAAILGMRRTVPGVALRLQDPSAFIGAIERILPLETPS